MGKTSKTFFFQLEKCTCCLCINYSLFFFRDYLFHQNTLKLFTLCSNKKLNFQLIIVYLLLFFHQNNLVGCKFREASGEQLTLVFRINVCRGRNNGVDFDIFLFTYLSMYLGENPIPCSRLGFLLFMFTKIFRFFFSQTISVHVYSQGIS